MIDGLSDNIPVISGGIESIGKGQDDFVLTENHGHYKGAPWSNVVDVRRGITVEEATKIASENSTIEYFMYVKGFALELEIPWNAPEDCQYSPERDPFGLVNPVTHSRIFRHGDVVFFKTSDFEGRWLGTAPGLADVYTKKNAY